MIKGIIFDFNRTVYDPDSSKLTDGIVDILEKLMADGLKLCLLSKQTTDDRRQQISALGLDKYFLDIQVIEGGKTEDNFKQCMKLMNLSPVEIIAIGDRVKGEIMLGNKLGMKTIWYQSGKFATELPQCSDEMPSHTITKLDEIFEYL